MSAPAAQGPNGRLPAASAAARAPLLRAAVWARRRASERASYAPAVASAHAPFSARRPVRVRPAQRGCHSARVRTACHSGLVAWRPPVARAFVLCGVRDRARRRGAPGLGQTPLGSGGGGLDRPFDPLGNLAGTIPGFRGAGRPCPGDLITLSCIFLTFSFLTKCPPPRFCGSPKALALHSCPQK